MADSRRLREILARFRASDGAANAPSGAELIEFGRRLIDGTPPEWGLARHTLLCTRRKLRAGGTADHVFVRQTAAALLDRSGIPQEVAVLLADILMAVGGAASVLDAISRGAITGSALYRLSAQFFDDNGFHIGRLMDNLFPPETMTSKRAIQIATQLSEHTDTNKLSLLLFKAKYKRDRTHADLSGDLFVYGSFGNGRSPYRIFYPDLYRNRSNGDDACVILTKEEFHNGLEQVGPDRDPEAMIPLGRQQVNFTSSLLDAELRYSEIIRDYASIALREARTIWSGRSTVRPLVPRHRPEQAQ